MATIRIRVPRAERSYIHWILEAHEGLAFLTEPRDADGDLVLTVATPQREELLGILRALATEVPVVFVA
jgi:hypothetical protein